MERKDITYQDKLDELKMFFDDDKSKEQVLIFVEGPSDVRLFRKFFDDEKCNVEYIPEGKTKLENCMSILLNFSPLLVGIRDADFLHLETAEYQVTNIFLTDFHDTEMTILAQGKVWNALFYEYSNLAKAEQLETKENLLKTIADVSYLRWLNDIENLELKFKAGFVSLMDFDNHTINFSEYFRRTLGKSPNAILTDINVIQEKITALKTQNPDLLQLTNGHDFLKTLAEYLREKYGNKGLSEAILASSLRIRFDFQTFQQTALFQQLNDWAVTNNVVIWEN
ncbi:MAG: hypothetical protein ACPG5B_12020 [Chitinophagales bacterium]